MYRLAILLLFVTLVRAQDDLPALRKAAESGDPKAQNALGVRYQWGDGVAKDYAEAAKWFQAAARQNYAAAQFNLALMYHEGQQFPIDHLKALAWFTLALDNGLQAAQDPIQRIYGIGGDTLQNQAYVTVARMYINGDELEPDVQRGILFLKRAAERKDAFAELNLCQLFIEGSKLKADADQGRDYCDRAIKHGSEMARTYLGATLIEGRFLPQAKEEGHRMLLKAAEEGDPSSFYALGMFEAKGTFGSADEIEAYKWLALGDFFGCRPCRDPLTILKNSLNEESRKQGLARAKEWDKKYHPLRLVARPNALKK